MNAAERRAFLAPQPLGSEWGYHVGTSSFGVLWRAARANCLQRSDLRSVLGVTLRANEDVFRKMMGSPQQGAVLARIFPHEDFDNQTYWRMEDWWPFGGPIPTETAPWRLRICPACARSSYHSLMFQMPGVHRCPWHGVELIETCQRCERPVLAGFREGLALGQCPCGHDLVDYVATIEGEAATVSQKRRAIDDYRMSATAMRRSTWLLAPEQCDSFGWQALHRLTGHSNRRKSSDGSHSFERAADSRVFVEDVRLERSLKQRGLRLSACSGLESFKATVAVLPIDWLASISAVGEELANALPKEVVKQVATNGDLRHAIGRLPAYPCGKHVFLQTECLHRVVLRSLTLLSAGLNRLPARRFRYIEAFVERAKEHPLAARLIERTILRVLLRGYADGTRVALGRQVPQLYDRAQTRPVTKYPWILLRLPDGQIPSARIAWTRQQGTD